MLAIQNGSDLIQTQGVLLDGKGAVNGADAVVRRRLGLLER